MKYQIAIYQRAGECWNLHRIHYALKSFDSLNEAEAEAKHLSESYPSQQILVITIHAGFTTETTYPQPEPTRKTTRVEVGLDGFATPAAEPE